MLMNQKMRKMARKIQLKVIYSRFFIKSNLNFRLSEYIKKALLSKNNKRS